MSLTRCVTGANRGTRDIKRNPWHMITNSVLIDTANSPCGPIANNTWKRWRKRLAHSFQQTDSTDGGLECVQIVGELLTNMEFLEPKISVPKPFQKDNPTHVQCLQYNAAEKNRWKITAYAVLELYWEAINDAHKVRLPKMGCQQSGRCCHKGVPRISLMETERIAAYLVQEPDIRDSVVTDCHESIKAEYQDPRHGIGVPCPILGQDEAGKFVCRAHPVRPYVCRLSAVSTPTSWDCPLWEVSPGRFDVIPEEFIRPFLVMLQYVRVTFERLFHPGAPCQMVLVGAGVLAALGFKFQNMKQPEVTAALPLASEPSDDLYLRKMEAPPDDKTQFPEFPGDDLYRADSIGPGSIHFYRKTAAVSTTDPTPEME